LVRRGYAPSAAGTVSGVEELTLISGALGADVGTPRRARREAREFLALNGLSAREDDVLLVISELITNSVLHAQAAPELVLRRLADSPGLVIEVRDPSPVLPVEREPDLAVRGGRGIRLVSAIADKWGVEVRGAAGKTIWAEFRGS
jgi:anti-sigma regulatory factor (Ser/Thr protein kinase)